MEAEQLRLQAANADAQPDSNESVQLRNHIAQLSNHIQQRESQLQHRFVIYPVVAKLRMSG